MGADLYLESLFNPNQKKWQQPFEDAVVARNALTEGTPEYALAQEEVSQCFEKMYGVGYFRDPYNSSTLLALFGLSWWQDISPLCDDRGYLGADDAHIFLEMLTERALTFHDALVKRPAHEVDYFESEYEELRRFLSQAIELREAILCSL